jgi:hypothetical protein
MADLDANKRFWVVANMVENAMKEPILFRKLANAAQRGRGKSIRSLT